jgi:hypothetical protein
MQISWLESEAEHGSPGHLVTAVAKDHVIAAPIANPKRRALAAQCHDVFDGHCARSGPWLREQGIDEIRYLRFDVPFAGPADSTQFHGNLGLDSRGSYRRKHADRLSAERAGHAHVTFGAKNELEP